MTLNLIKLWRIYRTYNSFVREYNRRHKLHLANIHVSYEDIDKADMRVNETYQAWKQAQNNSHVR
jgi:hypothetical protein